MPCAVHEGVVPPHRTGSLPPGGRGSGPPFPLGPVRLVEGKKIVANGRPGHCPASQPWSDHEDWARFPIASLSTGCGPWP